jgi:hypothetical protein
VTTRIIILPILVVSAAMPIHAETAHIVGRNGKWEKKEVRTVSELKGFTRAGDLRLSPYGGLASRKIEATGFFHTQKIDGQWWLIDPDGCLFISVGLCSVNHSSVDRKKLPVKFGNEENWAIQTGGMLKKYGFNTLGCWSDWQTFRPTYQRMPYTPRWNFMATYKNRRDKKNGQRGYPNLCMPVFDPEFEEFCDRHARQLAATKDDPWLLGHFSDNELPFRPDALTNYLALPESDTGHKAAKEWWQAHSRTLGRKKITAEDKASFMEYLARRYYSTVSSAIKKYDPNHLYLDSRVHGRTIKPPVFRGAKGLVDVMTVNYYHRWSAEQERLSMWVEYSGVPFIVSEWYAQSLKKPDTDASGAGFRVKTDADRGLFYQNLVLGLLENTGCVGWHWFKYGGDGDGFHKGIVSREYEPHTDILKLMGEINRQVHPLVEYLRK